MVSVTLSLAVEIIYLYLKKKIITNLRKCTYQMTKRQELLQNSKNADITRVVFTEKVKQDSAGQYFL